MKTSKPFMQFSKKIVVAVTIVVTAVCASAMVLLWMMADSQNLVQVVKSYINYAIIVFASYTGNSVTEKVLMARSGIAIENEEEQAEG